MAAEDHPDGTGFRYLKEQAAKARRECEVAEADGRVCWRLILRKSYRAALAKRDPQALRAALVALIADATAWVEAIDARATRGASASDRHDSAVSA